MPTHATAEISESLFPTETEGQFTLLQIYVPASLETETSTTEIGTTMGFSDATLPLSIACIWHNIKPICGTSTVHNMCGNL